MRLNHVEAEPFKINWTTADTELGGLRSLTEDAHALCEHAGVHQCLDLEKSPILTEATYKELASMIDGNFLMQKVRADVLNGIRLEKIEDNIMRFRINSSEYLTNRIQYQCSVMFDEWDEVGRDPDLNYAEQARMLLWVGNIRLHCTCPSYLYWGYQYLLTAIDAAIYPEPRKPKIRNPQERGIVCKHLNRILRVLPFYSGQMATALQDQFGTT